MSELISILFDSDVALLMLSALVFGGIVALIFGVRFWMASRVDVVGDRLRRYTALERPPSSHPPPPRDAKGRTMAGRMLRPLASVAKPRHQEDLGRLRSRLSHAGLRSERALFVFLNVKGFLCLLFAGAVIWFNATRPQPLHYAALFTTVGMALGFYLPNLWLHGRIQDRQKQINRALPDALDLLVTCVEAGLGLDAAMNRVAEEIALGAPLLSQELLQASLEIRAGSTRGEAFRRMAARTGVEDIHGLSAIIVQTEVFGTSIAKALRVTAEGMRVRRMHRAEERAATVAVRMTIPLVVCIFPSLLSILIGPAMLKLYRYFVGGG